MALALVSGANWLAQTSLQAPHLGPALKISAVLLLLGAVSGAQTGALSGFEAFKALARVNFYSGLCSFPITTVAAGTLGLPGVLWGMVASQALNCALNYRLLKRQAKHYGIKIGFNGCLRESPVLWGFSLPAMICAVMIGPVNWICTMILVRQPNGYAEMGHFSAANQWFGALLFLPGIVGQVVLPVLSERLGESDLRRSARLLAVALKLNALIVLPFVLLGCLASPLIMASYGEGFRAAWPTLVVLS
jgi:O-antigen/teichoic acid export membrane protein